jgi:hypothetical protein
MKKTLIILVLLLSACTSVIDKKSLDDCARICESHGGIDQIKKPWGVSSFFCYCVEDNLYKVYK